MRIRAKMGLSFFAIGGAYMAMLLIFIYLGNSIDTLRDERSRIDSIQILWSETSGQLYRMIIDNQPVSARNEWDRLSSNLDSRLSLFLSSQISSHNLTEADPHFESLRNLNRAWEAVQEEFLKIDLLFAAEERTRGPLLYISGERAAQVSGDDTLSGLTGAIINFTPYQDLFGNTLTNTIQYVDDSISARTRLYDRYMLLLFSLTTLFSVLFAALFAGRIARRIQAVGEAVTSVSLGDFSTRLDLTTQDEFGKLSASFNSLIRDLRDRIGLGFRAMYRLNHAVRGDAKPDLVCDAVAAAAADIAEADAAALLIWKPGEAGKQGEHRAYIHGVFPRGILTSGESSTLPSRLARGEHIILNDIHTEGLDSLTETTGKEGIRALAAHPLIHGEERIGAIIAIRREESAAFNDLDLFHLEHFAEFSALTLENSLQHQQIEEKQRLDREMELASSIQKRLVPDKVPQFATIRIAHHSQSAGPVSGDYFDVLQLPKNRLLVIVCDVAGKGLPASLVMVMIRTILHIIGPAARDAGTIMRYLNAGLSGSVEPGIFATISLLILDRSTRQAEFVNAGHLPALLLREKSEEPEILDTSGLPIGLEPKVNYQPLSLHLNAGDVILIYTDGISEAHGRHGGMYSTERLSSLFARSAGMDAENIKRSIVADIHSFTGAAEASDDQTLVVVKAV